MDRSEDDEEEEEEEEEEGADEEEVRMRGNNIYVSLRSERFKQRGRRRRRGQQQTKWREVGGRRRCGVDDLWNR